MMIKDLSQEIGGADVIGGGGNYNVGNANIALGGYIASPAVTVAGVSQTNPFGLTNNVNAFNLNAAVGGTFASPGVVVAPVSQQ